MAIKTTKLDDGSKKEEPIKSEATEQQPTVEAAVTNEEFVAQQQKLKQLEELVAKLAKGADAPKEATGNQEVIQTIIQEMNKKSDSDKYGEHGERYVDEVDQDLDDVLTKGVSFFAHQGGYVIVDDLRGGRKVATPFREPIIFNHFKTKTVGSGKNLSVENMCRFTSYSKKEVEWLKSSSFYGWKIFDDSKATTSHHAKLATHISRFLTGARVMQKEHLFKACESMGIAMSTDIENMRLQYAQMLAEKEVGKEESSSQAIAKSNAIETALMESAQASF